MKTSTSAILVLAGGLSLSSAALAQGMPVIDGIVSANTGAIAITNAEIAATSTTIAAASTSIAANSTTIAFNSGQQVTLAGQQLATLDSQFAILSTPAAVSGLLPSFGTLQNSMPSVAALEQQIGASAASAPDGVTQAAALTADIAATDAISDAALKNLLSLQARTAAVPEMMAALGGAPNITQILGALGRIQIENAVGQTQNGQALNLQILALTQMLKEQHSEQLRHQTQHLATAALYSPFVK